MSEFYIFRDEEPCPHCLAAMPVNQGWRQLHLGVDADGAWTLNYARCQTCKRLVFLLNQSPVEPQAVFEQKSVYGPWLSETVIRPRMPARKPLPPDVPDAIKKDYLEACLVLKDSPKSSAALSRRCLQHLLREKGGVTKRDLANQIQEVLDANILPEPLAGDLDAVRNIGAFAAHPLKSTNTGEIIDVEPGEAEWGLNILEELFNFYFVQLPAQQRRREALNIKLTDAKKPPMKTPPK